MRHILLAIAIFLGCSRVPTHSTNPMPDALRATKALYESLYKTATDKQGFVPGCDGTFFSALVSVDDNVTVKLLSARQNDGRWVRRPLAEEPCYPDHSDSTISRDAFIGIMWSAYAHKDLALVEAVWDYGRPRSWIMGDGPRDVVTMNPNDISTLAQLIHYLGGPDHPQRLDPTLQWPDLVGYNAHLEILEILLRHRIYDTIEETAKVQINHQTSRQPANPLFQCAAGNVASAIVVLSDARYYPHDRLPTEQDRCEEWLYQRDLGADWQPCPGGGGHTGGDFLFLASLIENGWCG